MLLLLALTLGACGRNRDESEGTEQAAAPTAAEELLPAPAESEPEHSTPLADASTDAAESPSLAIKAVPPTATVAALAASAAQSVTAPAQNSTTIVSAATSSAPLSPTQRMSQAQRLFAYGKYGEARVLLQELLSSAELTEAQRAITQLEVAELYLADKLYNEALTLLETLLPSPVQGGEAKISQQIQSLEAPFQLYSPVSLADKARYLRAEALLGQGQYASAIDAYRSFVAEHPEMAEVAQVQIAASFAALGNHANAGTAYLAAADATPDTVSLVRMLELAATSFLNAQQYESGAAAYERILEVAQNAGYRTDIQYKFGQLLAAAGNESAAVERWRAATQESPEHPSAYLALIELVNRNVPFDLYQRGYIDLQADAWFPAIAAFEEYLTSVPSEDERAALAMQGLGNAYLGAGDYASALSTLQRTVEQYPNCTCVGQVWLDIAATQAASGDRVGARRTYRAFARNTPQDSLAPEALWRSGVSALWDNNELEAVADLLALADTFPQSERAPDALYAIGLGAYRTGLSSQMLQMYSRLHEQYPEYKPTAVSYWLGRAHEATGDTESAKRQWEALVAEAPDGYYGILAQESLREEALQISVRMDNLHVLARPASQNGADDGSQAFAEAWLASWLEGDGAAESLATLPENVVQDPDLALGRLLIDLNLRSEAARIFGRLYSRHREEPRALYALMLEFERMGLHRLALLSAVTLIEYSPERLVEEAAIFVQQRAYPRPFVELVEQEAQANGIDPLLFFSLIRQESQFDDSARSVAAAQGLAQIIPDTAQWVAERLRFPNFTNELVYRPHINIQFGTYYLAWTRDYLDGNIISALVGYNAGPGNAEAWRTLSDSDDALFVEVLGVNEPRLYIYNILSNYYHYTRLYDQE